MACVKALEAPAPPRVDPNLNVSLKRQKRIGLLRKVGTSLFWAFAGTRYGWIAAAWPTATSAGRWITACHLPSALKSCGSSCRQGQLHQSPLVVISQVCRHPRPGGMNRVLVTTVQAAARQPAPSGPAIPTAFRKRPQTSEERALVSTSSKLGLGQSESAGKVLLANWPGIAVCASPILGRQGSRPSLLPEAEPAWASSGEVPEGDCHC